MESNATLEAGRSVVPSGEVLPLALRVIETDGTVLGSSDGGVTFCKPGWYEVLLTVAWDPSNPRGSRFSHTKIPGQQPLHSEAVEAGILSAISDGVQLLRGNTIFGPGHVEELKLEVWQDSGGPLDVRQASLVVRELRVPGPSGE